MFKFIGGMVVGGLVMAFIASTYPKETQAHLKSGATTAASVVSAGATSASNYANQHLNK